MRLHVPRELALCVLAFALGQSACVWANTEIVNFAASPGPDVDVPHSQTWVQLSPPHAERLISVSPAPVGTSIEDVCTPATLSSVQPGGCAHETWLTLDLDHPDWTAYGKFTLRVSWPASSPADFFVDTYTPETLVRSLDAFNATRRASMTRRMFARIRLVDTGVVPPSDSSSHSRDGLEAAVAFIVTLEPLVLGVLPASLLSTVGFIVLVGAVAGMLVVPPLSRYLAVLAEQVRQQTVTGTVGKRKDE